MSHFVVKGNSFIILDTLREEVSKFSKPTEFFKAAEIIHNFLISNKLETEYITFNFISEGFQTIIIEFMNNVIEILVTRYRYNFDKFVYMSSACPIERNIWFYKTLPFKYLPKKIQLYNTLANPYFNNKINRNVTVNVKPKKFLSMNGIPRIHRRIATSYLIKNDLIKDSYYSLDTNYLLKKEAKPWEIEKYKSVASDISYENLKPMFLSKMPGDDDDRIKNEDVYYFENSYFSLVQETFFDSKLVTDFNFYENILFSEKTYRPIYFKHPFVLLGVKDSLAGLREHGFKTFSPMIDETYDSIDDPVSRLQAALDEVKRLCSFSIEQWFTFQRELLPILEYNYKKLTNHNFIILEGHR